MGDLAFDLFDVTKYLRDKGVPFVTEGNEVSQGWIGISCPWCDDTRTHLGINLQTNAVSCWKCGKKNIIKLIRLIEGNCSHHEAIEILNKYQNLSRVHSDTTSKSSRSETVNIPTTFSRVRWDKMHPLVYKFIKERGFIPEDIATQKELYFGGIVGEFSFRLVLPIRYNRELVSYVGRHLYQTHQIPYLNLRDELSSIPVKSTLYGYDEASPGSVLVIVEGPLDQWKLGPGSVATYGTAWTVEQVSKIKELAPNKVVILYDSETKAQEQALSLAGKIWFCDCEILYLEGVKDPGELTLEEGRRIMRGITEDGIVKTPSPDGFGGRETPSNRNDNIHEGLERSEALHPARHLRV